MSLTYYDAASLAFGARPFTVREFRRRIGTPRAGRVLSELKTRGLVRRVSRATYRLLEPEERPDLRNSEWKRVREAILRAPMPKAWAGPTAVEAWTHGRYRVESSPFRRTFHLAVRAADVKRWRAYLEAEHVATDGRKHIGARVRLDPRPSLEAETVDGEPVVPRDEVVELVRDNPSLYADAEALLAD